MIAFFRRDILRVLESYKGLAQDFEKFVFDDGEELSLVNVNGTVPIVYRDNNYNIPVCFWLMPDYPRSAPMAFVKPTHTMQVNQFVIFAREEEKQT